MPLSQRAAEQGEPDAGLMYEKGQGVEPDTQEAMNWYRRAESGNQGAKERLRSLIDLTTVPTSAGGL